MAFGPTDNRLLTTLNRHDFGLLRPHLESVSLQLRQSIETPDVPIQHAYFIKQGIVSVVARTASGKEIEVGLIGAEGMTGTALVLGVQFSRNAAFVQTAGSALRVTAKKLKEVIAASPALAEMSQKFVLAFLTQTSHTALANGKATIPERLSRWLLMTHDRIHSDEMPLTHQFLSVMLGVRRPGVSDAIAILEGEGLIKATRGMIIVLDRKGLKERAGDFYGIPEAEYRRLFPPI
jgi:CRP-like cAMP-binding protein